MLKFFSPAKINLFLRIVGKRPDGYHELSSLFQAIDLGDVLSFQPHHEDLLTCSDPTLPNDEHNLVLKAAQLFRRKTGSQLFIKVNLEKHIPVEAGLGGGSGNAATTLWAMNQLSGQIATQAQLSEWGAEIGSDISFFLSQGTAHCTGRGELVQNLPPLPLRTLWIVKPSGGLSTPAVYKKLSLSGRQDYPDDLEAFFSGARGFFNDLEKPAFEIDPQLLDLRERLLSSGFDTVVLCGSGSSFFCLGDGQVPADSNLKIYSAKFINRSIDNWYEKEKFKD